MLDTACIKVLAFDVFGTVVDWHGSVAAEVDALALPGLHGAEFARQWRAGYRPAMDQVLSGELPWMNIDALHRVILDRLLAEHRIDTLDEASRRHLNKAWHRLAAWPDAVEGLARLRRGYMVSTLSNGNIGLLADMAKRAGLPWDCIVSAETFRAYKPARQAYLGLAAVFDVAPHEVMMVAAHQDDLAAARECGLATAYIERPLEFGDGVFKDVSARQDNSMHATDFLDLARQLGL